MRAGELVGLLRAGERAEVHASAGGVRVVLVVTRGATEYETGERLAGPDTLTPDAEMAAVLERLRARIEGAVAADVASDHAPRTA